MEYGIPLLELAIRNRQQAEADAAKAARLAKGLTIPIKLLAQTICGLRQRGFLGADCEDPAELVAGALRALEFTLKLPEEQLRMPATAHEASQTSFPPWGARRVIQPVLPDHGDERADPEEADGDPEEEDRKIAALKKLRNLLGGGRLSSAVVAEAEAADLERAIESYLAVSGASPDRQPTPAELALRRIWELHQRSPEKLVELFGTPFLEAAIDRRKTEQARIAREKRLAAAINILLPLSPEYIDKLLHHFAPMADPEDEAAARAAVYQALAIALDPPPPPLPQVTLDDYPLLTHPGAMFRLTLGR